jgi:hypothetical protein
MLVPLQKAFHDLLKASFPDVFTGTPIPVRVEFPEYQFTFDPSSADPVAGSPVQDDASDSFPFNPAAPAGPYTLTKPPYPGPRRVYLKTPAGDRQPLRPAEVSWDPNDSQKLTLAPAATRVLTGYSQVEVRYGVTAVFTQLKSLHPMPVRLLTAEGEEVLSDRAEALALAAFALNRDALMTAGAYTQTGGGYTVQGTIKSLKLNKGSAPSQSARRLVLEVEVELKISRALGADEGKPILRILSPGKVAGDRKVDVDIGVES